MRPALIIGFILICALIVIWLPTAPLLPIESAPRWLAMQNWRADVIWWYQMQQYHWELIPAATRLRGHYPSEGEWEDCEGNAKSYGDCAVSPDLGLDAYAEIKEELAIYKPGVGWIEGVHLVNDVTADWKRGRKCYQFHPRPTNPHHKGVMRWQ